ncbi:MAG: hypothetical protein GY769_21780 [bacterium]|nr:hypothetical protein [bacterium]
MRGLSQRLGRLVVIAGAVSLAVLHVAVLFRRVADGTLLRPLVVAQWLVAFGLLAVVGALHRRGVSILRGRPAAAFWIVVALMHGIVALPGGPGFVGVLNAVPVTDTVPMGFGLLAGALALLAGFLASRASSVPERFGFHRAWSAPRPVSRPLSASAARAPPA